MLYDVIIVGGGPAGLTAAIYAKRANLNVVLIERLMPGGQVGLTNLVENYPGFSKIAGIDLSSKMFEQVSNLGVQVVFSDVLEYQLTEQIKKIKTSGGILEGKTVILATGASAKELEVPNEKKLIGKGISYCATCDGNFFKGKKVAVIGGGNTALEDAEYLANLASQVYLIHRREGFRADEANLIKIQNLPNVKMLINQVVTNLVGEDFLKGVELKNTLTNEKATLDLDGLFVAIGRQPDTHLLEGQVELEKGYIKTNENMETNLAGVYAAGDIRIKRLRQIVTATADGAIAADMAREYARKLKID